MRRPGWPGHQRKLVVVEPVRQMVLVRPMVSLREMIGRLSDALGGGMSSFELIANRNCVGMRRAEGVVSWPCWS